MAIKIVTDSTSDLPLEMARELSITVVPLSVHFGTAGVQRRRRPITPDEFFQRLSRRPGASEDLSAVGRRVRTTSMRRLGQEADGIVSVHISSKMSGTFNAAVQAKGRGKCRLPHRGHRHLPGFDGARHGGHRGGQGRRTREPSLGEVSRVAREAAATCHVLRFALDTLEYLEKGGRIGKARALRGYTASQYQADDHSARWGGPRAGQGKDAQPRQ